MHYRGNHQSISIDAATLFSYHTTAIALWQSPCCLVVSTIDLQLIRSSSAATASVQPSAPIAMCMYAPAARGDAGLTNTYDPPGK